MDREELIDPMEERLLIEIAADGGGERVEDREGGGGGGREGVVGGKVGRRTGNELLFGGWFTLGKREPRRNAFAFDLVKTMLLDSCFALGGLVGGGGGGGVVRVGLGFFDWGRGVIPRGNELLGLLLGGTV